MWLCQKIAIFPCFFWTKSTKNKAFFSLMSYFPNPPLSKIRIFWKNIHPCSEGWYIAGNGGGTTLVWWPCHYQDHCLDDWSWEACHTSWQLLSGQMSSSSGVIFRPDPNHRSLPGPWDRVMGSDHLQTLHYGKFRGPRQTVILIAKLGV